MLSEIHTDTLRELVNIGIGRAAASLNELVGSHVELRVPTLRICDLESTEQELHARGWNKISFVTLSFSGGLKGHSVLVFPSPSAARLAGVLAGDGFEGCDLDSLRAATIAEVGNIVLNGVIGSLANIFENSFAYAVPVFHEGAPEQLLGCAGARRVSKLLFAEAQFLITSNHTEGDILVFLEIDSWDTLIAHLDRLIVVA